MTKEKRIEYMRERFPKMEVDRAPVVLQVSKAEIDAEIQEVDAYQESIRDKASERLWLTSDEM